MRLMVFALLSAVMFVGSITYAKCDDNCRRRGLNVPCPTMEKPFRTCASYYDDPICATKNTACKGLLVQCVATAMLAYNASAACIGMVAANIEAEGAITEPTVLVCALSAQLINDTTNICR